MLSRGMNECQIANELKVAQCTVSRDIRAIKREWQVKLKSIVENELPYEFAKSLLSMDHIINECWIIYHDQSGKWTNKNKIDALKMIKETQKSRIEIVQTGPLNLRVQYIEQELRDSQEESETPISYMNLKRPAINRQQDEDPR